MFSPTPPASQTASYWQHHHLVPYAGNRVMGVNTYTGRFNSTIRLIMSDKPALGSTLSMVAKAADLEVRLAIEEHFAEIWACLALCY
jgi:hypothetical protein